MTPSLRLASLASLCASALACAGRPPAPTVAPDPTARLDAAGKALEVRRFSLEAGGRWIGNGIAYGPHRDGQHPEGASPTREQLREDLQLISRRWNLLRMYNASPTAEAVLQLIRSEGLPIKVMLGCWIAPEEKPAKDGAASQPLPDARAANRQKIKKTAHMTNTFPNIVLTMIVNNKTQID